MFYPPRYLLNKRGFRDLQTITGDWLIESSDFSLIENNLGKIALKP